MTWTSGGGGKSCPSELLQIEFFFDLPSWKVNMILVQLFYSTNKITIIEYGVSMRAGVEGNLFAQGLVLRLMKMIILCRVPVFLKILYRSVLYCRRQVEETQGQPIVSSKEHKYDSYHFFFGVFKCLWRACFTHVVGPATYLIMGYLCLM